LRRDVQPATTRNKWAEVLSADAFSAFEEVGLENEDELQRIRRRFRDTVLSLGVSRSSAEVFAHFRGRAFPRRTR